MQDKELTLREQALKKRDVEFQDHLCRFIRFLQVKPIVNIICHPPVGGRCVCFPLGNSMSSSL